MLHADITRNHLLLQLPARTSTLVKNELASMSFDPGEALSRTGEPLDRIYFVERGLISLISGDEPGCVETEIVGCNGMVGSSALLGDTVASAAAIARMEGSASVMARPAFDRLIETDSAFRQLIRDYLRDRFLAVTHSVVAAARCTIEQRLAGWLLMAQDCLQSEQLDLTHECIASTLGVRRPGVTVALHILEGKHAVHSHRRRVLIRSREQLLAAAGCAYRPVPSTLAEPAILAA